MHAPRLLVTAIAGALLGGCYAASPQPGAPCSLEKQCPEPLACRGGTCVDPAACLPIDRSPGTLAVPKLTGQIAIDGDLSDWPTCFVTVDPTTAGLVRDTGAGGQFASGRFTVAADAGHLYVAAEVTIVPPPGDHPLPDVFLNNSVSVYVDGDGQANTAKYDLDAVQIVVDHANRRQGFRSGALSLLPGVESAAMMGPTTFTVELSITPVTLGRIALSPTMGFDIGLVGGDGMTMTSELVWFQRCTLPMCGCQGGSDAAPYCDAREFGTVAIVP